MGTQLTLVQSDKNNSTDRLDQIASALMHYAIHLFLNQISFSPLKKLNILLCIILFGTCPIQ
jgi:hypothetical protein